MLVKTSKFFIIFFVPILFSLSVLYCVPFEKLTILTKPIAASDDAAHAGVLRSLLVGLEKNGIANVNCNPTSIDDIGDMVHVVAHPDALRQAIELKKQGKIKKLLAGPNIFVRSNEEGDVLALPEVDLCIVPSAWVCAAYEQDSPLLQGRIKQWFAGVDADYWQSEVSFSKKIKLKNKNVLVYWKTESEDFCIQVEKVLKAFGWNPVRIRYGSYNPEQFKKILSKVLFSVFISVSESQGLALAESWAMDVPTFVWDAQEPVMIRNKAHWPISSCPYLTNSTGLVWKNIDELQFLLAQFENEKRIFAPRKWVLENMTDDLSAAALLNIIHNL